MASYITVHDPSDGDTRTRPDALVLESLEDRSVQVFLTHATPEKARAFAERAYVSELGLRGTWRSDPTHAVYAEWRITDKARIEAFLKSRQEILELRKRVLPTFFLDVLCRSLSDPSLFLILGLCGDREGAVRLCREHPEIVAFARGHPPRVLQEET